MAVEVRHIEKQDFNELYELFGQRKKQELLNWVYGHPCANGQSAFVAIKDERIVGAVGYVKSTYIINGEEKTGIIPLSWEVKPENRGIIGVRLLRKALSNANFYLGMDGSEDMKKVFRGLKFQEIGTGIGAHKVLMPGSYLKTLKKVGPRDVLRFAGQLLAKLNLPYKTRITLETCDTFNGKVNMVQGLVYNQISNSHIQWLKANPGMELHTFKTTIEGVEYGPILCFTKEIKKGVKRGQITHIPPLRDIHVAYYADIIAAIEKRFTAEGITAITTLITNPILNKAYKKLGYKFDPKTRPIVVNGDPDIINRLKKVDVHLSLAESDKSVRNI